MMKTLPFFFFICRDQFLNSSMRMEKLTDGGKSLDPLTPPAPAGQALMQSGLNNLAHCNLEINSHF